MRVATWLVFGSLSCLAASARAQSPASKDEVTKSAEETKKPVEAPRGVLSVGDPNKTPRIYANLWVQPQFVTTFWNREGSPNLVEGDLPAGAGSNSVRARADGSTTNTTFFRLRRTRVRLVGEMTPYMRAFAEIDVLPVGTGSIFIRNVLATGIARWAPDVTTEFSAGSFKVPLTYELLEPSRNRPFLERSLVSIAFFPGDRDMGAWAQTTVKKKLTVDAAVINGRAFGEQSNGLLPDYNRGKDVVARANYNFGPADVGVGGYFGSGTLPATQGHVHSYQRGAAHFEAALHHVFSETLGQTAIYSQATYGQNMDRGVRYAFALPDPPSTPGGDIEAKHQFGSFVRLQQNLGSRLLLGVRHELYTSNLGLSDNLMQAFGGLCSIHFTRGLDLRLEYIYGVDSSHPEGVDLGTRISHTLSTWMQARYD